MDLHKELEEAAQFDDHDENHDGILTLREYILHIFFSEFIILVANNLNFEKH